MTDKQLKKRYPEIWDEAYSAVLEDSEEQMTEFIEIIAHNAAFLVCYEIHKRENDARG